MPTKLPERIERRLSLHDLDVLLALAREGSMGKAAARLHTSQPAISRTIAELERTLGVPLFERHRHGATPTQYGKALFACGVEVFDDLRRGVKQIEGLLDPARGEVVIGCNPVLACTFVATAVEAVSRQYPRVTFRLTVGPAEVLLRELRERNVDLLVTRESPAAGADPSLVTEHLFDDSFVIAVGAGNPLSRRRKIGLHDLAEHPWVLPPPESMIGRAVREAFLASGMDPPGTAATAIPLDARLALLTNGRFITALPGSALRFPRPRTDIWALPVPLNAKLSNVMMTLKGRPLAPPADLFRRTARSLARGHAIKAGRAS